ncbi:SET domain-containing protein-lysine N-methyltransferase [Cupriavidus necator]|nr:SET domain-containing protein-lysine N-methyltransferase [Cupriavidus necator]
MSRQPRYHPRSRREASTGQPGTTGESTERQMADKAKRKAAEAGSKKTASDRIEVRQSGVHGKGVYAIAPIAEGERVIEYKGEHISWKKALERHPHDPSDPNHTFYFSLDDGSVIDAKYGGNRARWINHACEPNCEAREKKGRVFIHALRDIAQGEELFYDYGLVIDARYTAKLKKEFECRCGSPQCRGTMLAPKEKKKKAK